MWNEDAPQWVAPGERAWSASAPTWGIWGVPDEECPLLPEDMSGMTAIELGCGTGYVSAWMARRGARVTGIDISEGQLATARRLAGEHGIDLNLVHGSAEEVPLPAGTFDFAVSEYGAALWCDPYVWLPEAHRLLRPGGGLSFLTNHPLAVVCSPIDGSEPIVDSLQRDYFGMHRQDWRDAVDEPGGIDFNLPISRWFALFEDTGFDVLSLYEPRPETGGSETNFFVTADWVVRWPS
ncbi:MAG: class I SAM-dependent methyltransferase, partial [Actinobacteria bacterium]